MARQSLLLETHEEYLLGSPQQTYQTQVTLTGTIFFAITMILLLLIEVLAMYAIFFADPFFTFSWWTIAFSIAILFLLFIFLPLLFFIAWRYQDIVVTPIRHKITVSLYTNGLLYAEGRKRQSILWEQISSVQRLGARSKKKPGNYQLTLHDGSEVLLKNIIVNVYELASAIESTITERDFPRMWTRYSAGKPVILPGLCLNQHGISNSEEKLAWSEVEQITISQNQLQVKERGIAKDWLKALISQFPNVCVLETLLEHIQHEKGFQLQKGTPHGSWTHRKSGPGSGR